MSVSFSHFNLFLFTIVVVQLKLNFAEMCNGTGIPSILYDCQHVYQRSVASVSYHYKDPIKCVGRVQSGH